MKPLWMEVDVIRGTRVEIIRVIPVETSGFIETLRF